jgi:uncharacterized protein (TIGR03435 family)
MYKRTIQRFVATLASAAGALLAQAPAAAPAGKAPAFEVATIRPAPPLMEIIQQLQSGKAKIGMSMDGARVDMGFTSLADLIRIGFRVKPYQVQGPDWMAQQRFEIQAKIPDGVSQDLVPEMLQALLADRFKMTYHRDKKDLPVYALIVGKGGLKLTEASATPDAPLPDSPGAMSIGTEKGPMKIIQDGKGGSEVQGGAFSGTMRTSVSGSGIHLEVTKAKISELVDLLTGLVDKPVVDMTGLNGVYQLTMDLPIDDLLVLAQRNAAQMGLQLPIPPPATGANPGDAASTPGGAAIFQAVEKMGLKLDARKAPVDTIVVDHLEKTPTEN